MLRSDRDGKTTPCSLAACVNALPFLDVCHYGCRVILFESSACCLLENRKPRVAVLKSDPVPVDTLRDPERKALLSIVSSATVGDGDESTACIICKIVY